jgi:DNA-binding response OmpR family regulator
MTHNKNFLLESQLIQESPVAPRANNPAPRDSAWEALRRVLVIERAPRFSEWLRGRLTAAEAEVHWVGTIEQARKRILRGPPRWDLVVAEERLGREGSGLRLWRWAERSVPSPRFLLLLDSPEHLFETLLKTGLSCPPYLLAPFELSALRGVLRDFSRQDGAGAPPLRSSGE